ncbi:methyltransferase [Nocardioides sp. 1609]|uniref:class I SAM-dependent methyltransferase n=1 Tax=Nocardioides sp. 1609 TaxID=2508327 RepID=UPI001AD95B8C|nr:methyltransferase [Nocardioides sp. 1609]
MVEETDEQADGGEHYFTADPTVPFKRAAVVAEVWGTRLELASGSGVFARGRLDVGTAILFRETGPPALAAGSRVLDLGCGYGVIGLALAACVPGALVTAVDVNERALLLTRENAAALGLADRVTAATPDAVDAGDPGATYDEIWSNPPIRIGKEALHALLLTWLPRLAPGGRAVLVVGKNLGADSLQRWLGEQGFPTTRLASAKGFRVLESRRAGD